MKWKYNSDASFDFLSNQIFGKCANQRWIHRPNQLLGWMLCEVDCHACECGECGWNEEFHSKYYVGVWWMVDGGTIIQKPRIEVASETKIHTINELCRRTIHVTLFVALKLSTSLSSRTQNRTKHSVKSDIRSTNSVLADTFVC